MSALCEVSPTARQNAAANAAESRIHRAGASVLHWYDFICPYCYIAQDRNRILQRAGVAVDELAFSAHPEIPPEGVFVGQRSGAMYEHLEREAAAAGLPLRWPDRLPDTHMALAAAEWVRRSDNEHFAGFRGALFRAHFAESEDLGDATLVEEIVRKIGIDVVPLREALQDDTAKALLDDSEAKGRLVGVRGTPSWLVRGSLISGLLPRRDFEKIGEDLAGR